jgi:hypothetical protein
MKGSGLSLINVVKYLLEGERKALKGAIRTRVSRTSFGPQPPTKRSSCAYSTNSALGILKLKGVGVSVLASKVYYSKFFNVSVRIN